MYNNIINIYANIIIFYIHSSSGFPGLGFWVDEKLIN